MRKSYKARKAVHADPRRTANYIKNIEHHRQKCRAQDRRRAGWATGEHERAEEAFKKVTCCACCFSEDPQNDRGWFADHNHSTGMFRAYVCHPCNIMIGWYERYFKNKDLVDAYLTKHSGRPVAGFSTGS